MCGAKLPGQPSASPEKPAAVTPLPRGEQRLRVTGPSFLGLADEPVGNVAYLLEDDTTSSHRWMLVLILLVGCLGAAAWHWRWDLREWAVRYSQTLVRSRSRQTSYAAAPISTSGSEVAGAMPNAQTMSETPATDGATPRPDSTSQVSPSAGGSQQTSPNQTQAQAVVGTRLAAVEPASRTEPPPEVNASAKKSPPGVTGPSDTQATPVNASGSVTDALEIEGEKYLYGAGVPEDCGRAQRTLLAAAERASSRAESVLGTMYATGHCTARDFPLAYRWFAKALRQEPSNARLEHELQVLWNQMSADERQIAEHRE
jgi:hypothetical protein